METRSLVVGILRLEEPVIIHVERWLLETRRSKKVQLKDSLGWDGLLASR